MLGCALKTGAIIGNASPADANLLYDVGINIGLAFQLKDDLLDVYGDEATFGKKIGGDILCNKKTYLLIQALECAQGEDKVKLNRFLEDKTLSDAEKIKSVTLMYDKLGVKKKCEDKLRYYYEKAIANLDKISVSENKKQELRKLAEKLLSRND